MIFVRPPSCPAFPRMGFASPPSMIRAPDHIGTTRALTPDALTPSVRSLRLLRFAFPTFRPHPRRLSLGRFVSRLSARGVASRLRHERAGSPQPSAVSGSSSYGLPVHLRLLSTPPHGDAVSFDYRVATNSGTDSHRSVKASSRTHSSRRKPGPTTTGSGCGARLSPPSCPGLSRASTSLGIYGCAWMAGTSPAMKTWDKHSPASLAPVVMGPAFAGTTASVWHHPAQFPASHSRLVPRIVWLS